MRPLFLKNGYSSVIILPYNGLANVLNRNASPSGPGAKSILMLESLSDGITIATKTVFDVMKPDKDKYITVNYSLIDRTSDSPQLPYLIIVTCSSFRVGMCFEYPNNLRHSTSRL